jgi:hypothetical protein
VELHFTHAACSENPDIAVAKLLSDRPRSALGSTAKPSPLSCTDLNDASQQLKSSRSPSGKLKKESAFSNALKSADTVRLAIDRVMSARR